VADVDTKKVLFVALSVCLVCAVIVSASSVLLRPMQKVNKELDLKKNILASAGLLREGVDIEEQFQAIKVRLVHLSSGTFSDAFDPESYDQRSAARDDTLSSQLQPSNDPAKIKRLVKYSKIYMLEQNGAIEKLILPIHGYGLWSTLYGFIALDGDLKTVSGIGFYEHGETPGLGGEVDNPQWKSQWVGKKAYIDGEAALTVIKGKVNANSDRADYEIDGLSGATLTTRGINDLVQFWLGEAGFAPFIRFLEGAKV